MSKPSTRQEACEAYGKRWHGDNGITEDTWQQILEMLYEGKRTGQIAAALNLPDQCQRSLQHHRKEHLGYILFRHGVVVKDKRMSMAGTLSEAYRALIERCFQLAVDESIKPGLRLRATEIAQREMAELQRLAQATVAEFERGEKDQNAKPVGDVRDLVATIAHDVFGIVADAGRGGQGDG